METKKFVLLDIDYVTENNKPVVRLFGRECGNSSAESIIALDKNFKPYIYVIPNDMHLCIQQLDEMDIKNVEKLTKKDLGKKIEIIKAYLNHPQDVPKLRDKIRSLSEVKEIREH
ncbi:MAG: DNA polymerase, partial [Euryarchaeota archaeon]|nr:DNA polymerase [Euryarchaeota archaeon]